MTEPMQRISSPHDHVFLGKDHERAERRTWAVIILCSVMMVAEIIGGALFGSLALIADGLHMSTHAGALLLAALAYTYARKYADDRSFTFGTGKFGDLAGYTSAIILAMIALLIGYEAVIAPARPGAISFSEAIPIAVLGLAVNVASAWLLSGGHHHGHDHDHVMVTTMMHAHGAHHRDNNMRAAVIHVMADAARIRSGDCRAGAGTGVRLALDGPAGRPDRRGRDRQLVGRTVARYRRHPARPHAGSAAWRRKSAARSKARATASPTCICGGSDPDISAPSSRSPPAGTREAAHYRQRLAEFADLSHVTVEVQHADSAKG